MPRKVRELVADLLAAGFRLKQGGKGSHRKFVHPRYRGVVILSGNAGRDAQEYQEKQLEQAIRQIMQ